MHERMESWRQPCAPRRPSARVAPVTQMNVGSFNALVDTNVIAHYWLPGAHTEDAVALR